MSDRAPRPADWLVRACAAVAFLGPLLVALAQLGGGSTFRGDLPLLRGLAWVPAGLSGRVTPLLVQAAFFLPMGSIAFRMGLVGALCLAGVGLAVFVLTRALLSQSADAPRLAVVLATIAALSATLCRTVQREGAAAGGVGLVVLLVASVMVLNPVPTLTHPRRGIALGALLGILGSESPIVLAAVLVALAAGLAISNTRPSRATWLALVGGALFAAAWFFLPLLLRPLAPRPFLSLGRSVTGLGPPPIDPIAQSFGGASIFLRELGWGAWLAGWVGCAIGFSRARLRGIAVPLAVLIGIDVVLTRHDFPMATADDVKALHLTAMAALSVGAALTMHTVACALLSFRLPLAKGAIVFLVMTDLTLVAAAAEEGLWRADSSVPGGAEAFTDEAFLRLPQRAVLLLRGRDSTLRLWAARLTMGARPDVLILPAPLSGDTQLAMSLLAREPALQQTLRDLSLEGRAGEEALTVLADARPVEVELDPRWDKRVVSHLVADHLWLRFAPQPLGPSDRRAAFADFRARAGRVLSLSPGGSLELYDDGTRRVLAARLTDAAAQAALLGDREEALLLLERLTQVSSADRFVNELTQRLSVTKSGPIDLRGLLR